MSDKPDEPQFTPVTRVELRRASVAELIRQDDLLRGCPLCTAVPPDALAQMTQLGIARRYADQAPVFKEADAGDSLFLVLRGEVRLTTGAGATEVEVAVAHKGEVFGESDVLGDSGVRSTTATAHGEADVVELAGKTVRDLGRKHASLLKLLEEIRAARRTAGDEMKDFLDRW